MRNEDPNIYYKKIQINLGWEIKLELWIEM